MQGLLKHEDLDEDDVFDSHKSFTGSWAVQGKTVTTLVEQTCFPDDSYEEQIEAPIAVVIVGTDSDGNVTSVTIDDSNSEIHNEYRCNDIHVIRCARQ